MDHRWLGLLYRRLMHKYYVRDLGLELGLRARQESAAFIEARLHTAVLLEDRYATLGYALQRSQAVGEGLVCEFGVSGGKTLRFLARRHRGTVHGFDSFEGLPEDWVGWGAARGGFTRKGRTPRLPANVRLHVGWFNETLPGFLAQHAGPLRFAHLDADLYSSTLTVLRALRPRLRPGSVLVFDEYLNYPGWRLHEHRALSEFMAESGVATRFIAFSRYQGQAAVEVASLG